MMRRLLLACTLVLLGLAFAGPAQAASIWAPVASGTTNTITALDYHSDTKAWFGDSTGKMFLANGAGTFVAATTSPGPGVGAFTDLKFNPAGTIGFATTSLGKLFRSVDGGVNWSAVALVGAAWDTCFGSATPIPVPALYGISWASDGTLLYVVGGSSSTAPVILRLTNPGGAIAIAKPNQPLFNSGCKVTRTPVSDVAVLPGTPNYVTFLDQYFGEVDTTTDGLGTVNHFGAGLINNNDSNPRLAMDPNDPSRIWAGDHSTSGDSLYFQYSEDGGATTHRMELAGTTTINPNIYDIAYAGGTLVAVGDGGQILTSIDGKNAYSQPADGALAATNWRAVGMADGTHALIAGAGGALVKSTIANAIPDLIPPAGTISGPATPRVGTPAAYTLNASDNAGGSGVDPSSITWSAAGAAAASGNPASLTFTGTGFTTITASFRDLAGNAATATLSVNVGAAAATSTTTTTTASVPGGTITLGTPKACVPKNGSFSVRLSLKRRNAKGVIVRKIYKAYFYIDNKKKKTDKKPPFTQKLTVKKLKAGSKHKVKAKAYIRMSNGKTRTKSIGTTFKVCS